MTAGNRAVIIRGIPSVTHRRAVARITHPALASFAYGILCVLGYVGGVLGVCWGCARVFGL